MSGRVDDSSALVKVNNTPVHVSNGVFTLSSLNLSEGNNTITMSAVERAGNEAKPAVVTVALDTTPPTPPSLNPPCRLPGLPR